MALALWHVAVHRGVCKVDLTYLICKPIHFATCVTKDYGLCNGKCIVEIAQSIEFPFLFLDGDKVLLEAFESQLITLDQNPNWIRHKLSRHFQHVVWEGGRNDND